MRWKISAAANAVRAAEFSETVADPFVERRELVGVERHASSIRTGSRGRAARRAWRRPSPVTSSTWFGSIGLPQQEPVGAVVGDAVLGEEVRDRGRRRSRHRRAARRGDDRGGAGSASRDRARARFRAAARGSPGPPRCGWRGRWSVRRRPGRGTAPRRPTARPAAAPRRAVRPGVGRASADTSASTSQVPFDPSVQIRWWTTHPSAAHLARSPPQPNSTSSGWAPMASADAGVGRFAGERAAQLRRVW